jgi:hypothetical protein
MHRAGVWFVVAAVVVLAATAALVLARPVDPFSQPGTSWKQGFLSGETIRLLESGRYVSARRCDVCQEQRSSGTWRVVEDGYELIPDSGAQSVVLLRMLYLGCEILTPRDGSAYPGNPSQLYRRVDDRCQDEMRERGLAAGMTESQALEISRKAASMHGYDLGRYELDVWGDRTGGGTEVWMFKYMCSPWPSPPGCGFLVTIDRKTGSATVDRGQ